MSSKAEKRRARIGTRTRREGLREPNGRIDRSWEAGQKAEDAMLTVREARRRQFGWMSDDDARSAFAGSAVGRLLLQKAIDMDQHDAARRYLDVRNEYQRAIGAPPDYAEPRSELPACGMDHREWSDHARDRHATMAAMLADLQVTMRSPAPRAALDVIVVRDVDMPELVGDLRIALNALDRHFAGERLRQTRRAA